MDDFWSKRLENEREVSTFYRERCKLLEQELVLARKLLCKGLASQATIKSLALELDFMIMERLRLKDALNFAKALKLPEQVAVQYFACDRFDLYDICYNIYDIQPSSFKFLLKNKCFQIRAKSHEKTRAAMRTLDLDLVMKYLEQVKPDLNDALEEAAWWGFTDAVKLLLSDYGVDPSARGNYALFCAYHQVCHLEIVKILLLDARVDPSAWDNAALIDASLTGHLEIVKLLLSDDRVDPSAQNNRALAAAAQKGHLEIVTILLADDRVDPSAQNNYALSMSSQNGHWKIANLIQSHPRFFLSVSNSLAESGL